MRILPLLLVVGLALTAPAQDLGYAGYGELIITRFASAPFPHPKRAEGRQYKDQFFSAKDHYATLATTMFSPNTKPFANS